jgi:hypothetical protein
MRHHFPTGAFVRVLIAAVLAPAALLACAGIATASPSQPTMLQDDAQLVAGSQQQRDKRLDEFKSLGVEIVKVRLSWRTIAPGGKKKPSGFDGSNPAAYANGAWAPYDAIAQGAQARGMRVLFQLGGSAPEWATPGKNSAVWKPNAKEFGAFVKAVGTRYSGSYGAAAPAPGPAPAPGGGLPLPLGRSNASAQAAQAGALPRVSLFSIWNEPNLKSWLAPQTVKGVPYAPMLYRRLVSSATAALNATGHSKDQVLIGELLPYARSGKTGSKKIRPLAFLRELGCVNSHFRRYRGTAAKKRGCAKFKAVRGTGLAFHPYTLAGGPNIPTPNRDDASIKTLSRVTRTLDKLGSKRSLAHKRMRLWITEFGFQSSPPDRYATPVRKIPGFMAQSEWLAFHNKRVSSYSQYPLVDDRGLAGFQSGLRLKSGKAKPYVYSAFRHTFYVRKKGGSKVEAFGIERAASSGKAAIQARSGRKGKWKTVATASINGRGYFDRRIKVSGASRKQFRYVAGSAHSRVTKAVSR